MRRFIKTVTVARHLQFTVLQDGDFHEFTVQRWAAVDAQPEIVKTFTYAVNDLGVDKERARTQAIALACKLAEQEKAARVVMGGDA